MPSDANTQQPEPFAQRTGYKWWWPYFVVGYVAVVLLVDALATIPAPLPGNEGKLGIASSVVGIINHLSPTPLSSLRWHPKDVAAALSHTPLPHWAFGWMNARILGNFDVFKFIFWFLIPLLLCKRNVDLQAFSTARWRKMDWRLLGVAAVLGFIVVCLIPFIPGMDNYYRSAAGAMPFNDKLYVFAGQCIWTFSWLLGWEFMHRYFLLNAVAREWRFGWLFVPFFEWAYHLQKHRYESRAMLVFSILATQYVLRRRNVSLPFLAHLLIEIALPLTLLFGALNPLTWALAPGR